MASDDEHSWDGTHFSSPMHSLLEQEWITPATEYSSESITYTPESLAFTPDMKYAASGHDHPAMLTSAMLRLQQSPTHNHQQLEETQYPPLDNHGLHHGLGITGNSPTLSFMPALLGYNQSHHDILSSITDNQECTTSVAPNDISLAMSFHASLPTKNPVAIAPDPHGLQMLEEERRIGQEMSLTQLTQRHTKQRRRTRRRSSQLDAETAYTEELRMQNIPWKEVVNQVNARFGGNNTPSRLQMRVTRRRQRLKGCDEDNMGMCAHFLSPSYISPIPSLEPYSELPAL
ncbi:hypothetical protein FQN57_001878 [Myotisia sp. PD_48]|nr:hypothetical protein FQN57_001878 [Myotisia sp. PD_48]